MAQLGTLAGRAELAGAQLTGVESGARCSNLGKLNPALSRLTHVGTTWHSVTMRNLVGPWTIGQENAAALGLESRERHTGTRLELAIRSPLLIRSVLRARSPLRIRSVLSAPLSARNCPSEGTPGGGRG